MSLRRTQYSVSRATGRYGLTGELDITWQPRIATPGAPTVVLLHGLLGTLDFFQDTDYLSSHPKLLQIGPMLASYGMRVIAINGGPTGGAGPNNPLSSWGNPAHTARLETVRTNLSAPKISLLGVSMGGYAALQYAVNHPGTTGALVDYSGVSDIVEYYNDNGRPDYVSEAWGVASGADLPPAADITTNATLVGMPWLAFHDDDDSVAPVAAAQAMADHIGSSARLIRFPTGGHDGTLSNADLEEVVSWIWDYS